MRPGLIGVPGSPGCVIVCTRNASSAFSASWRLRSAVDSWPDRMLEYSMTFCFLSCAARLTYSCSHAFIVRAVP